MKNKFDTWSIEDRISWYKNKIRKLMALIEGKTRLSTDDCALAQTEMKQLKERFSEDCRIGGVSRRFDAMTQKEQQYYTTVMEAETRILAKWKSDPLSSNWHRDLYSCMIDLDFYYPNL